MSVAAGIAQPASGFIAARIKTIRKWSQASAIPPSAANPRQRALALWQADRVRSSRLICADHHEEHGHQASFIQCSTERLAALYFREYLIYPERES